MTYKNTKFEDSPVMRSLEKLAQKKGLIKNDPFKKEASAPAPSYVPTENLNQNILKLCSGLRSQGFGRYASELESKFLALKAAENILEEAHPEGSVTLKDMEGDATVEDCADQKKMIEDIIKKTPKGKFGGDIVNLCKIVLAEVGDDDGEASQEETEANTYFTSILIETQTLITNIVRANDLSDYANLGNWIGDNDTAMSGWSRLKSVKSHFEGIRDNMNEVAKMPVSVEAVAELKKNLNSLNILVTKAEKIKPATKVSYFASIKKIGGKADKILAILRGETKRPLAADEKGPVTIPEVTVTGDAVSTKIGKMVTDIEGYKSLVAADMQLTKVEKQNGLNWLVGHLAKVQQQKANYEKYQETTKGQGDSAPFSKNLATLEGQLQEFYKNWLA